MMGLCYSFGLKMFEDLLEGRILGFGFGLLVLFRSSGQWKTRTGLGWCRSVRTDAKLESFTLGCNTLPERTNFEYFND